MKKLKRTRGLAFKIVSFLAGVVFIVIIIATIISRQLVYRIMLSNARESIGYLAGEKAQLIDRYVAKAMALNNNLQDVLEHGGYSGQQVDFFIRELLHSNPELVSVYMAYEDGDIQINSHYLLDRGSIKLMENSDQKVRDKDWYSIPYTSQKPHWSEPWFDSGGSGRVVCSYSLPLYVKGAPHGILRMDIPVANLQKIIVSIRAKKTGYACLLSRNGTFIAHPADSLVMRYNVVDIADMTHDEKLRAVGNSIMRGETAFLRLKQAMLEKKVWIYYRPLISNGWRLVIIVPDAEVFADLRALTRSNIFESLFILLLVAMGLYLLTRAIRKPVQELVAATKILGRGDFDTPLPEAVGSYESELLAQAFQRMQLSLKDYVQNLQQVTADKNRMLAELQFASQVQRRLIPANVTEIDENAVVSAFGILEPAGEIGGDLFDYFWIDENHFCFAIADVVGKGVAAAMTMTMATTFIRREAAVAVQPPEILGRLNSFLAAHNLESDFVTMILGILDTRTGSLIFSNAGHVPLYLLSKGRGVSKFSTTHATALGFFENIRIGSENVQLAPGDEIVLVTDGISDTMNEQEEIFGTDRLVDILENLPNPSPETAAQAIFSEVRAFADPAGQTDDITILVIEYIKAGSS
ncbi:MAG TPA: SpoIIE family protein phosphatase [Candidatus Syntrophosphaera sp.]|nr:SpoIIE family protein phosphatase [Candidatus Syntrophosphaera sp.]